MPAEVPEPITAAECVASAAAALGAARRMAADNPAGARALVHVAVGWRELALAIAGCPAMLTDPGGDRPMTELPQPQQTSGYNRQSRGDIPTSVPDYDDGYGGGDSLAEDEAEAMRTPTRDAGPIKRATGPV